MPSILEEKLESSEFPSLDSLQNELNHILNKNQSILIKKKNSMQSLGDKINVEDRQIRYNDKYNDQDVSNNSYYSENNRSYKEPGKILYRTLSE